MGLVRALFTEVVFKVLLFVGEVTLGLETAADPNTGFLIALLAVF